jgi:hypothetical protein
VPVGNYPEICSGNVNPQFLRILQVIVTGSEIKKKLVPPGFKIEA